MIEQLIRYINPGVWSKDIEDYPGTEEDIRNHPEKYKFVYNGYQCELVRNFSLCWCGYVTIPETHPDFEKDYESIPIYVHGGLTYADNGKFGFDCIHGGDLAPTGRHPYHYVSSCNKWGDYCDYNYVVDQIKKLADGFKEREVVTN